VRGDGVSPVHPSPQHPSPHHRVLGVDVARFGDCETVLALREGEVLLRMEAWQGADLMATTGRIVRAIREFAPAVVVVDAVGVGAGVVDRLREVLQAPEAARELGGVQLVAFSSGERALDPTQFKSRRDEAFWGLRERYEAGQIAHAAHWEKLVGQLAELRYSFTSGGQTRVETKEELRRRGLPSPDWADAAALAFAPQPQPQPVRRPVALGSTRPRPWE
jgi:hypothetical protein